MNDSLKSKDHKSIINLYEDRFDRMGASHKSVGWGSKLDQYFKI